MPVLALPRQATATLSPALPIRNAAFQEAGITLRRGQFSLLAAAPGVGKSVLATNLAVRTGVPTLFLSADSDEWTVTTRVCSILTGQLLENVEKHLNEDSWQEFYGKHLTQTEHVDWCYNSRIDLGFLTRRVQAYEEILGEPPHLIVVDNIKNAVEDMENQYPELDALCMELQELARIEQAHVLACCHVKGRYESGYEPIGLGGLLGNIGKIPEVALGLNRVDDRTLNMTIPKQRGGKSGHSIHLPIDYETATIGGFQ